MSLDQAGMSPALATLIRQRQRLGQDRLDEVWDGVYVMAPDPTGEHAELVAQLAVLLHPRARTRGFVVTAAFNLGAPRDFRVPGLGVHRERPRGVWQPNAPLVVEVLSPRDRVYEKFGFYATRGVDEIVIVRPVEHDVEILAARGRPLRTRRGQRGSRTLPRDSGRRARLALRVWPTSQGARNGRRRVLLGQLMFVPAEPIQAWVGTAAASGGGWTSGAGGLIGSAAATVSRKSPKRQNQPGKIAPLCTSRTDRALQPTMVLTSGAASGGFRPGWCGRTGGPRKPGRSRRGKHGGTGEPREFTPPVQGHLDRAGGPAQPHSQDLQRALLGRPDEVGDKVTFRPGGMHQPLLRGGEVVGDEPVAAGFHQLEVASQNHALGAGQAHRPVRAVGHRDAHGRTGPAHPRVRRTTRRGCDLNCGQADRIGRQPQHPGNRRLRCPPAQPEFAASLQVTHARRSCGLTLRKPLVSGRHLNHAGRMPYRRDLC